MLIKQLKNAREKASKLQMNRNHALLFLIRHSLFAKIGLYYRKMSRALKVINSHFPVFYLRARVKNYFVILALANKSRAGYECCLSLVADHPINSFQVVLNEFLEQAEQSVTQRGEAEFDEQMTSIRKQQQEASGEASSTTAIASSRITSKNPTREPSPTAPMVRNKVGNGLHSKNSKNRRRPPPEATVTSATASSASNASATATSTTEDENNLPLIIDNTTGAEDEQAASKSSKRQSGTKRPLLDLNLDEHRRHEETLAASRIPKKRPKLVDALTSAIANEESGGSNNSSAASSPRPRKASSSADKIALSEDHLHGPFNFLDHRRPSKKHKNSSSSATSSSSTKTFQAMREDLKPLLSNNDNIDAKPTTISSKGGETGKKTPTLVDLSKDAPESPIVVDLSQTDSQEIKELFNQLANMFPTSPLDYLEEMAEELVGKPAAIDRFITEHLARNSQPPDYWKPRVKAESTSSADEAAITAAVAADSTTTARPAVNLIKDSQGVNMSVDALEDNDNSNNMVAIPEEKQQLRIRDDLADPQPGPSSRTMSPIPGPSHETIDLVDHGGGVANFNADDSTNNMVEPMEVDDVEDHANRRLETLISLFPQADPEFLHTKVLEFAENEDGMNQWIQESMENNAATGFPSRKDYEKRQQEAELMEKYTREVTVEEILEMYDDPDAVFSDTTRTVTDLYKKHSLTQLKKDFRFIAVHTIHKVYSKYNGLFVPCVRSLKRYPNSRKSRRPDHECPMPEGIDINFLKVTKTIMYFPSFFSNLPLFSRSCNILEKKMRSKSTRMRSGIPGKKHWRLLARTTRSWSAHAATTTSA